VDRACQRFGSQLHIRFYAHYGGQFDCRFLREIPSVRSLGMDCLRQVANAEELGQLSHLEELRFGVFEADVPRMLEMPALFGLRKLTLAETRKKNFDLSPLSAYRKLEDLFLNGHARGIDVLQGNRTIRKLSLSQMRRKTSLGFVRSMTGLRSLNVILGGRTGLDELFNEGVEELWILRVQGLENVDLNGFPGLRKLKIEDQLKIVGIDLEPVSDRLQVLSILNCKRLKEIRGMELLSRLESLRLGRTAIEPEALLAALPKTVREVSLWGYGAKRDSALKEQIASSGFAREARREDSENW
jgi:hypothetical protein